MMRVTSLALRIATALCAVSLAAPGVAKTPGVLKDWEITATSTEAVVVMRVQPIPIGYALSFSKDGSSGFMSRVYMIGVRPLPEQIYVGRKLKPGTYRLDSVSQQGMWSSCFGNATRSFTVSPGKVYYLGTFNSKEVLQDLQSDALARGKSTLSAGGLAVGWSPKVQPSWTIADGELSEFRTFAAASMPRTTAPLEALETQATHFEVSGTGKAVQVCG